MTPPPSPKNSAPNPGSPPPCTRFSLENGAVWLSLAGGTEPDPGLLAAGLERRGQRDGGGWVPLGSSGERAWVKGGRLSWKSSLRHGASRAFLGRPVPRLREMGNLLELIRRAVPAAEPLLAGVERGPIGRPTMQFLATREVRDAVEITTYLSTATGDQRLGVLASAGALASQMHRAGFVHRNFFARNLVRQPDGVLTILDPWRGEFVHRPRCHVVDLAGFLADAGRALADRDRRCFLESYAHASEGAFDIPKAAALQAATDQEARRMEVRVQRRRGR